MIEMPRTKKDIAATLAEVGEHSEREHDKVVKYVRVGRPPKPDAERGQVYSIRIPVERLEQLRLVAEANGKQPAAQARDWILERLDGVVAIEAKRRSRRKVSGQRATALKRSKTKTSARHAAKKAAKRR
jgi:hypothetical protein